MYGLDPAGHHATSLLFHMANAALIFLVLRRMTGALWRSAFVAALFAFAPTARRVRGLGGGAQGCVKHVFLGADPLGLCALRAKPAGGREPGIHSGSRGSSSRVSTLVPRLRAGGVVFCVGIDGQAHGGHAAIPFAPAGFLAIAADAGDVRVFGLRNFARAKRVMKGHLRQRWRG